MIKRSFHHLLNGVSILPALLVVPATADVPNIGFFDDFFASVSGQMYDVFSAQNTTGFEVGKITIGTDMSSIGDDGNRYGIDSIDDATQYVKLEQSGLPAGAGDISLYIPLDPNMTDRGLNTNKLVLMAGVLGSQILPDDGSVNVTYNDDGSIRNLQVVSDGFVRMGMSEIQSVMVFFPSSDNNMTAFFNAADEVIENGKIEESYFYTNDGLVIDGHYGNMVNEFISNHRDSLVGKFEDINDALSIYADNSYQGKVVKGIFGLKVSELKGLTPLERATAIDAYIAEMATTFDNLNSLKLKVGEVAVDGGNVTFANGINVSTSKLDINNGATVLIDEGANTNVVLEDISITYTGQGDTPTTVTQDYVARGATISGTNTNVTVANGAILTVAGQKLDVTDGATLVNNGTLNINTTNTTFDEDLSGNGTLVIGENATLNIGTKNITQNTITLNGTMNATVRNGDDAQLIANTFNGNGTLNLSFATDGIYHVFGNGVFNEASTNVTGINVNSSLYELNWINEGKDLEVALKPTPDIATDNELSGDAATTVAGLAGSSSEALNELGVAMQEKLAEGTPEAIREVEQATGAINPETESVSKTVSNSIQNALTDLVSSRLALLSVGRSAGDDSGFTSGGVWVQGLYNKTKLNDSFNSYTRGIAAGLDGKIGHDVTVGLGYSFNHSDIALNSHDTDVDSNTVFVYGQYKPSGWFVNGIMNYTWSEYEEKGLSSMVPKTSKYDTDSFGAAVSGGYEFNFGLALGLGARYLHVNGESHTTSLETTEKFDSTDYLTGIFGTKWGLNIKTSENTLIRPELRYALKYDVLSDATMATVMMPGTAAYTLTGDRLPRIGNEFGLGLIMRYRAVALSLNYDIEIREDYTSQTGMARIRYKF